MGPLARVLAFEVVCGRRHLAVCLDEPGCILNLNS